MSAVITLHLSDKTYHRLQRLAQESQQDLEDILSDGEGLFGAFLREFDETPFSELSDEEVLAIADSRMDPVQNAEMLRYKDRRQQLSPLETQRLERLLAIYEAGQLRMGAALGEAVKRGLQPARLK